MQVTADVASLGLKIESDGVVTATKRLDELDKQAGKTERSVTSLADKAERAARRMRDVGKTLTTRVSLPLAGIGAAALKVGGDFQYSMNRVAVLSRGTGAEIEALRDQARELGRTTQFTASQAADAMGFLAMAGFKANEVLGTMPATLNLAAASGMDLARTADVMSNIMQGYGLATEDASRASDVLVAAMTRSNTNLEQLGIAMKYAGPIAQGMGISFEEAAAALGMMGNAGIQAGMAGTSLRGALTRLASPVGSAASVMRDLGLNVTNADGSMKSLTEIVEQLERSGASTTQMIEIFGQRAGPAMAALVDQGSEALRGLTTELEGSVGEAAKVASVQMEGFRGAMLALKSAAEGVLIAVSESGLLEWAASLADRITGLLQRVAEMNPALLRTTVAIAGIAAAIGPALVVMGALIASIKTIIPVIAGTAGLVKAIYGLRVALIALSGPVGIIAGTITGLTIHYINHRREIERLKTPTEEATNALNRMREATQGDLGDQDIKNFQSALGDLNREIEETQNRMERIIETRIMMSQVGGMRSEVGDFSAGRESAQLAALQERLDTMRKARAVEEARLEIAKQFPTQAERNAAAQQFWNDATDKGRKILERFGIVLPEAEKAVRDLGDAGEDMKAVFSEDFNQSLNRLAAELQGPVAQAQLKHNELVEEARKLYEKGEIGAGQLARAIELYGKQLESTLDDIRNSVELHDAHVAAMREHQEALQDAAASFDEMRGSIAAEIDALSGGRQAWEEYRRAVFVAQQVSALPEMATDEMKAEIRELAEELYDLQEAARIEFDFENLIDSFHPLSQAMRRLGEDIKTVNDKIAAGDLSNMEGMFVKTGIAANAAFGAIMSGIDRSSKEYRQMEVAQQAVNVAMGIAAILQQGMGDPYTAIPRMVAMAAMVASLVDGISGLSGGGGAAARQERQGTGTVLGDSAAKSESILAATQITADATSALVGINRGMLRALQSLQAGIVSAVTMIARGGTGTIDAPRLGSTSLTGMLEGLPGFVDLNPLRFVEEWLNGLFGFGKTKIIDEGIRILAGTIDEAIEGALFEAFVKVRRKGLFGSKSGSATGDLPQEINDQFALIFASMLDTVRAAAEALGISLTEIEQRIESFRIAATEISLQDLSPEEQQAEIMAVFSAIFDDLAGHVVPFIGQFQKVGEGLAETLIRVATSVQVAQEAINRLGLNIDDNLGPERMAQVAVGLMEAAGGIENFISQMESFMSKFAPEAHKFAVAQSDITRALEQMNFELPATREGFWQLIQTIDGTTEAGQRQIATLLSLTEAADTYYSALEEIEQEREWLIRRIMELEGRTAELRQLELEALDESNRALQERIWALEDEAALADLVADVNQSLLQELSPAHAELSRLMSAYSKMMTRARELGASEETLMNIRRLHSLQLNAMAATLRAGIQDTVDSLFGAETTIQSTASTVSSSMDSIRDSMINALQAVRDWMDSSLLSDTSPLMPAERLGEAQSQFDRAIQAALGGDVDAMSDLPGLANQLLSEAGSFYGTSTAEFDALWMQVRQAMGQVADMDMPDQRPPTREQMGAVQAATESTAKSAYQQMLEAQHLIGQIDTLSRITGNTPADIAEELGVPMGELIKLMGGNPSATADALGTQFNELVTDFGESLNPLMGVEQSQLEELRNIVTLLGGDPATDGKNPLDYKIPGDQMPVPCPQSNDATNRIADAQEENSSHFREMNARLQRLEDHLESISVTNRRTADNTGQSVRQNNELVIIQRQIASRRETPRIRA